MAKVPVLRAWLNKLQNAHVPKEARVFGDSLADLFQYQRGYYTSSMVPVNEDQALRHGAVWACVDLISELASTLPLDEYRRLPDGQRRNVTDPGVLITNPGGDGYGVEVWLKQVLTSLLLRGNAYGLVLQLGLDGWPTQIETIHPDRVAWYRDRSMGPAETRLDGKDIERWPGGPLWHVPAYTLPGSPVGLSPIGYAAETIGLGLATQKFGAQWFADGAHPTSTVESEAEISQAQALVLKQRVVDALRNNREPLVLGAGIKLNQIQVSPDESQFLDTIGANVADVARFFRVPPEMIGSDSGSSMTYANVESRGLALLTYTLNPWLVRLERALTRLRPGPRFVKFNVDALVRTDLATRYQSHDGAIRAGWKSVNEVRRIEDYPPIPDGDQYLWPPGATAYGATEDGAPANDGSTQPAGTGSGPPS